MPHCEAFIDLCLADCSLNYEVHSELDKLVKHKQKVTYSSQIFRYGKKCTDECLKRGSGYYWCHTDSEGNWDYCSPDPILGVHVGAEREFTRCYY